MICRQTDSLFTNIQSNDSTGKSISGVQSLAFSVPADQSKNGRSQPVRVTNLNRCTPIIFTFRHNNDGTLNTSNFTVSAGAKTVIRLPSCRYYDKTINLWSNRGCVTFQINETHTRCACTHLTAFNVGVQDFKPNFRTFPSAAQFRQRTTAALMDHPEILWAIVATNIFFFILLMCIPRQNDKPLLAQPRPWTLYQQEAVYGKSLDGITTQIFEEDSYFCTKLLKLWWLELKNSHPLLSLCVRPSGTNWSGPQRAMCKFDGVLVCKF